MRRVAFMAAAVASILIGLGIFAAIEVYSATNAISALKTSSANGGCARQVKNTRDDVTAKTAAKASADTADLLLAAIERNDRATLLTLAETLKTQTRLAESLPSTNSIIEKDCPPPLVDVSPKK